MTVQKIHTIRGYSTASPGVIYTCPTGRVARIRISAHFIDFRFTINDNNSTDNWLYNESIRAVTVSNGKFAWQASGTSTNVNQGYYVTEMQDGSVFNTLNPGLYAEFLTLSAGEDLRLYEEGNGSCSYHLEIIEEDNI